MMRPGPTPQWVYFLGWWGQLILDDPTIIITAERNERPFDEAKEHFYQLYRRNEPVTTEILQAAELTITACNIQENRVALTVERA